MGFNDFWINNNGKKEHLNNAKHGVRKEQVDEKFHNLFDAYDANGDGTLETEELGGVFKGLTKFAGADKTLDSAENKQVANLFANQAGIENADFMGFVRSVSKATEDIVDSKTTPTADGGREVTTTYKDGTVETISYYPDGEYKFKKLDQKGQNQSYYLIGNNTEKQFSAHEIENQLKTNYEKYLSNFKPGENKKTISFAEFKSQSMKRFDIRKINSDFERHNLDLSERAKKDIEVRDFVLSHYIDTHKAAQEALESMGILDDVGAAINARAGELWNSIKNVWNGTEEEYQNFYELSKKFEPNYDKALRTDGRLDVMRNNPEMFFRGFETDFKKDMGHQYNLENSAQFQQTSEQYQNAQILKQRIDILNKAMQEVRMYQSEQDALVHSPAQSEGLNPASHIVSANKLLLQYFNNDQEAVDMILNGTIGNAEATIKAISGIKEDTEKLNKAVLDGKTFDQIQEDYKSQYKAMYGTDFVPDELTEKVMDAKATGGMVKLAAITIVSILITKSPIMAEISGAAAGSAEATGAAANLVRTLVTKYGQTAVQQGIKLAMTSGTLATDVGLTLINQATSERGVNGEELLESTKGSAKYIFFGAYVGAPMAQAVSRSLGKIGATSRLFEGGTKTANGAIQTTSISGDKLIQNFVKGGNKVLTTGGAFLTDVAAFTGLEVATEGANLKDALSEQGQMLSKLKLMNHVLEYMLGAKTHTVTSRANLDAAIEKSGVKNWNIKEIKTPQKTQYIVDIDGLPVGKFEDANQLATAMLERVTANYSESAKPQTRTQTTKPEGEVKATPETEVETKTARPESRINIPTGKLEAPNAKFAETDEAFRSIVTKRSADIKELDKINDIDEFCRKSFELMKEEMGLEDSDIRLKITDKDNYYDHETNTVYISRNWAGKEKGHVKGKGDKAEIFGGIAHELNHYLQWKEIVLNFDSENPNWNNIISYLQQFEGAQKNIEYLIEKYPDNTELKEFFEKAKSYQDNWLNYTDAFDESGKLKTGAEYDKYRNQTVEAESFRRGDIVAEEYRKSVADVKLEGAEENPLLTRLETANDRESFVAIRDEIKKMPNSEEKTQMMQAYLKKYNEWSSNPSRPDIRMQYMPERDGTEIPVANKTTTQTVSNKAFINIEDAKAKLQEFASEERDYTDMIIQRCSMNNQVSEVLLNEAISLLKSGVDSYDVSNIVYGFKVNDEAIDYNRIKKFHELVDKGTNAEDASHLLGYSADKKGLYSEDLYNKIMSLNEQDYDASRVLDACKFDGEVVESTWQKALELNSLGFKNRDIENVLKSCRIKESEARTAKTIGFNDEAYSKAKLLFEEHKFNPENISRIIKRCTVDGKFSQECFDRAVSLHDKINESNICDFVRYPNELLDFMLEIKDKYNIKEYKLDYILRECVSTVDGKTVASPICMSKAEELITKYNIEADDVGRLLYASKVDGELDLKLYEEVIKMHQAGFDRIGSIIESLTTKGQNEGETSQVNYDLLQKTKEWKELGIEDDWISQYCREFEELKIDVNKHDLVKEYHSAEFKPNEIIGLLDANGNLENLSLTEFRDKVFELKKLGLDNNKIINLLNEIGMPNGWGTPKFKLSKQNLDMVIDMIQRGVKEPDRIVRASYENYELNQDILNTAYERIKDGISEDRLSCLNSMRRYFTEMPELEDVLINLSKTVREDYDYNSFYSLANNVYNEMYNSKSGKDVANNVIEALKKGAKEEDIQYILDKDYGNPVIINHDNLNKSEVISQIKTKLLNALVEHPENTEQIKDITNSVARIIVDGDLSQLDFCLKYPDRYRDILKTEHPLDWNGNRRPELSNRARNLMLQFDSAGVPIDDVLRYTDILCEHTSYLDEPIPENTLNKIIELRNNQKLDDNTLKMIRHLPFVEKTPELIDYVMELKEKNLLPEFNEQNEYDIPVLVRILPNNSETGKLGLYENYKEILDFYVKNKDVLRYERVNGENHYITEFDDIVRNYKDHHSGIDKVMDLEPFEAMAEIVRKTSVSPETLNGIIGNGYADKLKVFTDKVDLEKYSNELNLIFSQLNRYYDHNSYSDILNENISKRDLEYLLDMQKLMCENVKENENPQILDNRWFRKFIGEKEIPAEALDKLRYYVEMELADPNRQGRYINIDRYHHTVRLYENSPENIERIESIMYNKGFEDGMYEHILSDLSSTPEVLNRQLDLIENILDYTGELSGHKSYLQSDLISILRDAKTLEDVNVKIELWEQLKSQLQSKSSIQKFWDANVKKQNNLGMALMCVEGTNATNKSAVLAAMANKKYNDLIWNCAGNIDKNNVALIEDIIKNDRLKNPDRANFAGIVVNTSKDEFKAKFVQENFDKIPQEDLQKATSILSEINGDLIIRLYNDKELNFPKEHILDIAPYCNQMNIDLVTRLCTDKNLKFPADQIKDIARALNLTNLELAEKLCTDKSLKCPPDKIVDILSAFQLINVDTKSLSLSQKINTLGTISSMDKTLLNLCRQYSPIDIDAKIAELTVSLGKKKDIINVSAAQQQMFVQNMMANNNQNTETVLKNFDFEQYGKQGLPLKYTREQFTANIENLIKDLSPEEQEVVLEHFGLIKGSAGFDGLPTNKPFNNEKVSSQVNEIAQKVQDEIETFTARNQINTGDATADNVLNALIKGLPEFTSIVGKEQHGTHAYSVDIHTLKVLQSAMNNPLYEKLSDRDKTILKIAALCHDLGKRGGVVDTGHASSSAEYVTAILDKFPFPQGMKDRIIDIVDNHHWFEAYNTGSATAEDVAVRCRRPEDFMIYEILAKADFENVNKDFHISRSEGVTNQAEFDKFMQDKMEAIDEALTRMYSRANLVFDTQFMQNGEKFPRQTIEVDGEPTELKVLNLGDLKGNDSLQEYGFSTGVTKESARFTVHMTDPVIASMESVMILTQNSLNQSAWSTSLIKASNNRTYCNRKFGFVLDVDQANISEANYANTGSGCGKGLETFKRILFNANGSARTYVKDHLIKELSKKGVELNDNEYAQLSRFLVAKKYTTQITKNIKIGDKIINAKDLVECLEKSRDALFEGGDIHSEIVPINPRVKGLIAKVEKLEDCPEEFLKFAKLHNLPIILMKPTKE